MYYYIAWGIPLWFTGLQKLTTLNVEGCNITAAFFEYISGKKFSFHSLI